MANVHLPIIQPPPSHSPGAGSLGKDGTRKKPYPADVSGRWTRLRKFTYYALIALWIALPWIPINGHPAVFLDIDRREFFLFGATFNAQDIWLMFFVVTGFGFGLLYGTTLLGRVWCGWACPQTVFIEAFYRPIERLVNGPRNAALRRAKSGLGFDRAWRAIVTHALYIVASLVVSHIFVAYFVSLPKLFAMIRHSPAAHPEVFAWMIATTGLFYGVFGVFREQFCVVICPYGRLQSALMDDDSLVIGYDERRGEPRGKKTTAAADSGTGDCVDCNRCVVVCPTGIDIRDGLQLDCIGCTACIDACDEVMTRLSRPRGLIRYDSLRGLRGEARRFLRPRVYIYTALLVVGVIAATLAVRKREPFEANLLRLPGIPYTRDDDGNVRNGFELHIVNKTSHVERFHVVPVPESAKTLTFILPMDSIEIEPLQSKRVPFFVTASPTSGGAGSGGVSIRIETSSSSKTVSGRFLGGAVMPTKP